MEKGALEARVRVLEHARIQDALVQHKYVRGGAFQAPADSHPP